MSASQTFIKDGATKPTARISPWWIDSTRFIVEFSSLENMKNQTHWLSNEISILCTLRKVNWIKI